MNTEQERAFEQILHSIQQAQIPGNDWRRELKLIESTCRAVLQSQDREDAERYRWLRKHWFTMTSCYDGGRVEFTTGQPRYSSATEADVDEAIDHARRIEGERNARSLD